VLFCGLCGVSACRLSIRVPGKYTTTLRVYGAFSKATIEGGEVSWLRKLKLWRL